MAVTSTVLSTVSHLLDILIYVQKARSTITYNNNKMYINPIYCVIYIYIYIYIYNIGETVLKTNTKL